MDSLGVKLRLGMAYKRGLQKYAVLLCGFIMIFLLYLEAGALRRSCTVDWKTARMASEHPTIVIATMEV